MTDNLKNLRLELIKLTHTHAYKPQDAIKKAEEYEAYITQSGDYAPRTNKRDKAR